MLDSFSSPHIPKNFRFWFIVLQNGTNDHANFLAKRWLFSILDFGLKRPKNPKEPHEGNNFCILDRTKYDFENFGIFYSIIPK